MVGAEAGQHITITIKNMSTNELIANAVAKTTVFGTANVESTESRDGAIEDTASNTAEYVEGDTNILNAGMLKKFYAYDSNDLVDTTIKDDVGHIGKDQLDTENAPTAADFAALNAFAKSAIKDVSTQRSDLGAIQNRLEHTISNLDNIVENTTSAESQIRDTDIATEMVRYANNNLLQQAGTSMLSQANQANSLALSLLG